MEMTTCNEEVDNEICALNAIYTPTTLTLAQSPSDLATSAATEESATTYILQLPPPTLTSLRLRLPAGYPTTCAPTVLGLASLGNVRKGEGSVLVACFRDVLAQSWNPGEVCLFAAVEEFAVQWEEVTAAAEAEAEAEAERGQQRSGREDVDWIDGVETIAGDSQEAEMHFALPIWTASMPLVILKSTFVAHVCPVTSLKEAHYAIASLVQGKRFEDATHNISAWRIRRAMTATAEQDVEKWEEDYDDDGEGGAGKQVLALLRAMDVRDAVVVVSRWFGGIKLGGRRFGCIVEVAKESILKAGLGIEGRGHSGKPQKKGRR